MSKNYVYYAVVALVMGISTQIFSQSGNISMNLAGNKGSSTAILDLSDVSNAHLGFLMPKVGLTGPNDNSTIPSPVAGLIVWDTTTAPTMPLGVGFYYWDGSHWDFLYNSGSVVAGSNLTAGTGISSFTYNGTAPATVGIANTAIAPGGTYGSSSVVPQITVNAQGQIIGESNQTITPVSIGMQNHTPGTGLTGSAYNGSTSVSNWAVAYGNTAGTAVQGNTAFTITAGTGLTGGGTITEGSGGSVTLTNAGVNSITANTPAYITGTAIAPVVNVQGNASGTDKGGVLYSTGPATSAVFTPTGTSGYIFQSNGTSTPAWVNPATSFTGTFILNQNASPQTANFWVTGTGTLGGLLTANGGLTVAGAANIVGATNINNTAAANTTNINNTLGNTGAIAIGNNSTTTLTQAAITENINASAGAANATNIGTGTTTGAVKIGNTTGGTFFPQFTVANGVHYTSTTTGQLAQTAASTAVNQVLSTLTSGGAPTWSSLATLGGVTGSGTTNYHSKWTSASSLGNSLIYDNGTQVAIGTTTPGNLFDVEGGNIDASGYIMAGGTAGGAALVSGTTVINGGSIAGSVSIWGRPRMGDWGSWLEVGEPNGTNGGMILNIQGGAMYTGTSTGVLIAPTLRNTLDNGSGYMGIGTTAPTEPLDVEMLNVATTARFGSTSPVCLVANSPMVGFNSYWGTLGTTYVSSSYAGMIQFSQNVPGAFQFLTAPFGAGGNAAAMTPWMTILNTGNVGVNIAAPTAQFEVATSGDVPYALLNTTTTANKRVRLQYGYNGTIAWELGTDYAFNNSDNMYFYDRITGTFGPVILSNGNVGIGTTTPVNRLDIGGGHAIGAYAGVNVAPTNGMIVSGTVGIGTPTPTFLLDVSGTTTQGIRFIKNAADARMTLADPTQAWSFSVGWATGGDWSLIQEGFSGNAIYASHTNHNVGINTSTPSPSAALDVTSTTQGFLPPRMTAVQMNAIASPVNGLIVYNTTTNCVQVYSNGWQSMWCMGNHGMATFTTVGANTWMVPTGVTTATIYLWGGGGGGGGGVSTGSEYVNGGGGGGGACGSATIAGLTPGGTYNITIGAGGAAGTSAGANGGVGGTTTFTGVVGAWTTVGGGGGTTQLSTASGITANGGAGGSTGTGTGITVRAGGNGSLGYNGTSSITGFTGSGGGGGGSTTAGGNAVSGSCVATNAGAAGTGTYSGGLGAYNPNCSSSAGNFVGTTGSQPGGGGSGDDDWTAGTNGGVGGAGQVIIVW